MRNARGDVKARYQNQGTVRRDIHPQDCGCGLGLDPCRQREAGATSVLRGGVRMGMRNTKVVQQVKDSFLTLCAQYERLGQLLALQAHALPDTPQCQPAAQALKLELSQYQEMGEEMKQLGKGLDLLGGKSVLYKAGQSS